MQFLTNCFSLPSAKAALSSPSTIRRRSALPLPDAPAGNYLLPLQPAHDRSYLHDSPVPSIAPPIPYHSSSTAIPRSLCPISPPAPSTASPAAAAHRPSPAPFHPPPSSQSHAACSPSNIFSPPPSPRALPPQSDPAL